MRVGSSLLGAPRVAGRFSQTTSAISRALSRLSTGQRVSSPKDDAGSYSMAVKLEAQVRGLNQEVRNNASSLQAIESSQSSLDAQLDLARRMREIAVQASSSSISASDRNDLANELKALLDQYRNVTTDLGSFQKTVGNGSFASRMTVAPGGTVYQSLFADFNEDGKLDLVQRNSIDGLNAHVMLGAGNGSFGPRTTVAMSSFSLDYIQTGDVNGDGHQDIVGVDNAMTVMSVALGNGDGTFQAVKTSYVAESGAPTFRLADINRDGNLDAVVSDLGKVYYKLGNGAGQFTGTATTIWTVSNQVSAFDVGDFNGDGLIDVVTMNYAGAGSSTLTLALNNGNGGTFSPSTTISGLASVGVDSILVGDVNHDGLADVLTGSSADTNLRIITGNVNGSLTQQTSAATAAGIYSMALGDINGDGNVDLVFGTNLITQGLGISYGNGNGTFQAAVSFSSQRSPYEVVNLADLDGDGVKDVFCATNLYKGRTKKNSSLGDLDIGDSQKAQTLVKILDQTIDSLSKKIGDAAGVHSKLDQESASKALLADTLDDAKLSLTQADVALQTTELVRLQILQEAQTAVFAQGNLSLSMVLKLLG